MSLRVPRAPRLLPAALLLLAAGSARAQTATPADSFPARAGSWALEAGVSNALPALGALRFVGARTAVGLNAFGSYSRRSSDASGAFGYGGSDATSSTLGVRLGLRRYTPMRGPVAAFGTLGAVASYSRYRSGTSTQRDAGAGGFGELGAAYVLARRLSVSAFTRAEVTRRSGRVEGQAAVGLNQVVTTVQRTRGWDASAGGVGLSATLFF